MNKQKRIGIAADHGGFNLKQIIKGSSILMNADYRNENAKP
jgi:hypothetical protein